MEKKLWGNYEILEQIGAGGMGEVYRARDLRLGRDVAVKLLPAVFAGDADRLSRFEREARLLAALNHPHIAAIYGLEQAEGKRFLVLELVPGEDLSARISRGPIPLDEALPIARQIAEALEYAHEQNIVHRDLKPANIKLTPEGRVKVLDFGLAKALDSEDGSDSRLSQSPTILASSPTVAGVILGTAAYMSPEQARGKRVDKRSDVFAFGSLLHEMLTGSQAFPGETVSDTLASVLKLHPDTGALPEDTPRRIRQLLRRCLEKDPKLRLRDIGEARIAIDLALAGAAEEVEGAAQAPPVGAAPARRSNLFWGIALVGVAAAAFFLSRALAPSAAELPLRKFALDLPESEHGESMLRLALSPDGERLAYIHDDRLWIREFSKLEPVEIQGSNKADAPCWSPDSEQVAYRIGSTFYRVSASGGASTAISNTHESFSSGTATNWTADGRIVFSTGALGVLAVPALGGDPVEVIPKLEDEVDLHEPSVLPGGRGILFVSHREAVGPSELILFADGQRKSLLKLDPQRLWTPRYASTGHILYRRSPDNAGIWALPFSLAKLEVTGEPFLVAADASEPCPGPNGQLAYRSGNQSSNTQLAWISRDASLQATWSDPYQLAGNQAISPDGRHVACTISEDGSNGDVWVIDLERGTRQRLSSSPSWEVAPAWSADGKTVYYVSAGDESIRARRADGTGVEQYVHKGWAPDLSADGKWLVYDSEEESASDDIYLLAMPADSTMAGTPIVNSPAEERNPNVSPSVAYVAYQSDESGQEEIYLTRFPSGEGKWQVSVGGGTRARWDPAGGRLYYVSENALVEVDIAEGAEPRLGNPRELFKLSAASVIIGRTSSYDVDRGGQRFAMSYNASAATEAPAFSLVFVENWASEFTKHSKK